MRCFDVIFSFINYGIWIIIGSNESFKFPAFLGNDALINGADAIFLYLLF